MVIMLHHWWQLYMHTSVAHAKMATLIIQKNDSCEKRTLWPINVNFLATLSKNYNMKSSKLFMKNGQMSQLLNKVRREIITRYLAFHSSLIVFQAKNLFTFTTKKGIQLCFKRLENPGTSVYTIMKDLWGICPWTSI